MNLSADGKEIYIIYQQDKSTKAHPLDYLNSRKEPYLHIGQPIESYGFLDREKIYPTRTVKGEKDGYSDRCIRREVRRIWLYFRMNILKRFRTTGRNIIGSPEIWLRRVKQKKE